MVTSQTNPFSGLFRSLFSVFFERTTCASDGDRSLWGSKLWNAIGKYLIGPAAVNTIFSGCQPLTTPLVTTAVICCWAPFWKLTSLLQTAKDGREPFNLLAYFVRIGAIDQTRQSHLRRAVQLREATAVPGRKTGPPHHGPVSRTTLRVPHLRSYNHCNRHSRCCRCQCALGEKNTLSTSLSARPTITRWSVWQRYRLREVQDDPKGGT